MGTLKDTKEIVCCKKMKKKFSSLGDLFFSLHIFFLKRGGRQRGVDKEKKKRENFTDTYSFRSSLILTLFPSR
jgi:hypothetical protein